MSRSKSAGIASTRVRSKRASRCGWGRAGGGGSREDAGNRRLVGYVTGTGIRVGSRVALVQRLPGYMVPAVIVVLASRR